MIPAIVSGTLAMMALAHISLASADAALVAIAVAGAIAAARVRGPLAGGLGGAAAAVVAFVGARHGDVLVATSAGAIVAVAPLGARAFPSGTWRLLVLLAACAVASSARLALAPWAAAIVLTGVACSRARAEGRVDLRAALALGVAIALIAPSCVRSAPAAALLAILVASHVLLLATSARLRREGGVLLEAAWPLLDAVALAACGHPLLAIECVAFVPFARRMALVELFVGA